MSILTNSIQTNFYGAIGLASTIGKNGFAAGQHTSNFVAGACYYVRPWVELQIRGQGVLERLENAATKVENFDKEAKIKCKEWETWAWQNYEESKNQDELNEDWRKFNNQPTKWEKAYDLAQKVNGKVSELTSKLLAPVIKIGQKKWQQYSTKFFSFYFCSNQLSTRP